MWHGRWAKDLNLTAVVGDDHPGRAPLLDRDRAAENPLQPGGADRSYGIDVGIVASLPQTLAQLFEGGRTGTIDPLTAERIEILHGPAVLLFGSQAIGGAVVRIEAGAFVELRNQEFGRIVIRLDRIDAVALHHYLSFHSVVPSPRSST